MEDIPDTNTNKPSANQETGSSQTSTSKAVNFDNNDSEILFIDSPVYEPEEIEDSCDKIEEDKTKYPFKPIEEVSNCSKRTLDETTESINKIQKLEANEEIYTISADALDNEVSEITSALKRKIVDYGKPSTSRVRPPSFSHIRSSQSTPKKFVKRRNSADILKTKSPKIFKYRSGSVDITAKNTQIPFKIDLNLPFTEQKRYSEIIVTSSSSQKDVGFVSKSPAIGRAIETIVEENHSGFDDSEGVRLFLTPSPDENDKQEVKYSSDPVIVNNRVEILESGNVHKTPSEGFVYSDTGFSQSKPKDTSICQATDQESTDSVCSLSSSPEHMPTVTSRLISKISNGNSSTPTQLIEDKRNSKDSDNTPDMKKLNTGKGKGGGNESYRISNTTTPSTISPLQNGHSLPMDTPQAPIFDIHTNYNEDNEFVSLFVVRTDNNLGKDMFKEYTRFSKKFNTGDAYLADVSVSNSPSSITSGGMINLPNRTSFVSTVSSSSTSSNRTSDGTFVVPQPPRKMVSNPSTSIKGYGSLLKMLHGVFAHFRDSEDGNHTMNEDKVSVAVQTSSLQNSNDSMLSNGNASPEEVSKCDKVTPKSSLKKTRFRGRRHMAGKTKRAILPTQPEEAEYMHGMNSPEMVPTNNENGKESPEKCIKDEKPLSTLVVTPKSISKLKQKRRPTSPRPATPVEKASVKQEFPGYAPDTLVLAKWVNKCYYSGKVLEITEPNKYLIEFDDNRKKVLLDEFIIFGDTKTLPLVGQSVYAVVDEEQNYEPALVLGVEENDSGTITYKCTTDGDTMVLVTRNELYLTEDQARLLKESHSGHSPSAPGPVTPRRRQHRELDLDNIIQGPRSARMRDKGNSSTKKRITSPKSPKASTSGLKTKSTPGGRKRVASESSEMSESSNSAPSVRIEEVAGVEPEVQRTPRKIDGVKAGPLQLKGAAKQNIGKKNSKLTKFENDEDTVSILGPILAGDIKPFAGMHFLLTCTETPKRTRVDKFQETRHYSSEEDGETTSCTDAEDLEFCNRPFNKERLKEQLEAGGGVVYSHFDDVPKSKYSVCKLIAPRPCLTAKYIQCLAADIPALSHAWVIISCVNGAPCELDSYALPAGWSIQNSCFVNWMPPSGKRNATFFKDKIILLCGDQDTFVKFWERVCTLAGAITRVVNEEDLNTTGALALLTDWDCPHEVQNKANQDNIPLVSTTWVVQCLIETRVIPPTSHDKFSFMYTEPE